MGQDRTLGRLKQKVPNVCLTVLSDFFPRCIDIETNLAPQKLFKLAIFLDYTA